MKKTISLILVAIMVAIFAVGCSAEEQSDFDTSEIINLVSREDGSGTRGAFVEIVGILEKDADGNEVDRTYEEAVIQNGTDAVLTTVAGDEYAIGYISLGSLNDTVKAVSVGGAQATAANVQDSSYAIARPFNIAYKGELSSVGADFLNFILSSEGQAIAEEEGYVQVGEPVAYEGSAEGSLVVAGSTSVTPLMEKLSEAYQKLNSGVSIEIQSTGSSAGMQSAIEGTADISMASRELKDSELAELTGQVIAMDGIAVIVNKENPVEDLTIDQIKSIFVGQSTEWTVAE